MKKFLKSTLPAVPKFCIQSNYILTTPSSSPLNPNRERLSSNHHYWGAFAIKLRWCTHPITTHPTVNGRIPANHHINWWSPDFWSINVVSHPKRLEKTASAAHPRTATSARSWSTARDGRPWPVRNAWNGLPCQRKNWLPRAKVLVGGWWRFSGCELIGWDAWVYCGITTWLNLIDICLYIFVPLEIFLVFMNHPLSVWGTLSDFFDTATCKF